MHTKLNQRFQIYNDSLGKNERRNPTLFPNLNPFVINAHSYDQKALRFDLRVFARSSKGNWDEVRAK